MENNTPQQWFKGLDSIRFICAFIVLLSHIFTHPSYENSLNSEFAKSIAQILKVCFNGTAAVIIFFILSGFLIHSISKTQVLDIKKFYTRRFIRILVPLLVVLLLGYKFGHPEKTVLWSLICELVYYFLYPFILKVKLSWKMKFLISFIISLLTIFLFAFNEIRSLLLQAPAGYHGYYWQIGPLFTWIVGLPCWLLGVIIAENIRETMHIQPKKLYFLRILVFSISVLLSFVKAEYLVSFIISMNFFALVCYYWLQAEIIYFKNKKPIYPFEFLGKSSYSLYILHPFVIIILGQFISFDNKNVIFIILITIAISHIFYLLIEKPAHNLARRIALAL